MGTIIAWLCVKFKRFTSWVSLCILSYVTNDILKTCAVILNLQDEGFLECENKARESINKVIDLTFDMYMDELYVSPKCRKKAVSIWIKLNVLRVRLAAKHYQITNLPQEE